MPYTTIPFIKDSSQKFRKMLYSEIYNLSKEISQNSSVAEHMMPFDTILEKQSKELSFNANIYARSYMDSFSKLTDIPMKYAGHDYTNGLIRVFLEDETVNKLKEQYDPYDKARNTNELMKVAINRFCIANTNFLSWEAYTTTFINRLQKANHVRNALERKVSQ